MTDFVLYSREVEFCQKRDSILLWICGWRGLLPSQHLSRHEVEGSEGWWVSWDCNLLITTTSDIHNLFVQLVFYWYYSMYKPIYTRKILIYCSCLLLFLSVFLYFCYLCSYIWFQQASVKHLYGIRAILSSTPIPIIYLRTLLSNGSFELHYFLRWDTLHSKLKMFLYLSITNSSWIIWRTPSLLSWLQKTLTKMEQLPPNPLYATWNLIYLNLAAALYAVTSSSFLMFILLLDVCTDIWTTPNHGFSPPIDPNRFN